MNTSYDVFICHASEDKDEVARPLASLLSEKRVAVWYDEFSLKVGDSLRQSIDRGLAASRFGIVIVSPAFFIKRWTAWELDGLLEKDLAAGEPVILPIWHNVSVDDVRSFSPSLAGRVASMTSKGLEQVSAEILKVIQPEGSALIYARKLVLNNGAAAPPVTDDWWLDVAAFSASNPVEDTFQEASGWGRWGFPLPPKSRDPRERGERLAQAALQMVWQQGAEAQGICQITPPEEVHSFIDRMPGLASTCWDYPQFLASYAPQLVIPGFGGDFEKLFDEMYQSALEKGRIPDFLDLRRTDISSLSSDDLASIACNFVQGDINGPEVQFHEHMDYIAWLLSSASDWLPSQVGSLLCTGMRDWGVWQSDRDLDLSVAWGCLDYVKDSDYQSEVVTLREDKLGPLHMALCERFALSSTRLALAEAGGELAQLFFDLGFLEAWPDRPRRRRK